MTPNEIIARLRYLRVPHEEIAALLGRERQGLNRVQATKMLGGKRAMKASEIEPLTDLIRHWEMTRDGKVTEAEMAELIHMMFTIDAIGINKGIDVTLTFPDITTGFNFFDRLHRVVRRLRWDAAVEAAAAQETGDR